MVSGGPFGLEEVIGEAGFRAAFLLLLVLPWVWSLPVALLVGELGAAYPEEGGYYGGLTHKLIQRENDQD